MISSSGVTEVRVAVSATTIRAILSDADALGRVLPGCESCVAVEDGGAGHVAGAAAGGAGGGSASGGGSAGSAAAGAGPRRFRLVLATRVGFLTVTADVDATLLEPDPGRRLNLELDGRTRGFDGGFTASIPFELLPVGDAATTVRYEVSVATRGTVALAGDAAVAAAIHELADDLVGALEREAAGR